MDLQYKGINRKGRHEWFERDLAKPYQPDGKIMEDWEVEKYKPMVKTVTDCIGREPTKDELSILAWLSSSDNHTIDNIMSLIKSAHDHGSKKNTAPARS